MIGLEAGKDSTGQEAPAPPPLFVAGTVIDGKYRMLRRLGEGGMGEVWEAEHLRIGKKVAIKGLHARYAFDVQLVQRFEQEARAASAIGNDHIIQVMDLGRLPSGSPFMVMEHLEGRELADIIDNEGPLSIQRASKIARQVCAALHAVHDKGIVHRDMKPQNVFVMRKPSGEEFVKVLDFGISKFVDNEAESSTRTRTGITMGTPAYMSPEQAQGRRDTDHRTDIYAVGGILFEMLCRRVPFAANNYAMVLAQVLTEPPPRLRAFRPDIPELLEAHVLRALSKDPNERFASAAELSEALYPFEEWEATDLSMPSASVPKGKKKAAQVVINTLVDETTTANGAGTMVIPDKGVTQRPWGLIATVVGIVALVVFVVASVSRQTDGAPLAVAPPDRVPEIEPPVVPVPAEVVLKVVASPREATISIDGKPLGNPIQVRVRKNSTVILRTEAPGFLQQQEAILVEWEKEREKQVSLQPLPVPQVVAPPVDKPPEATPPKPGSRRKGDRTKPDQPKTNEVKPSDGLKGDY